MTLRTLIFSALILVPLAASAASTETATALRAGASRIDVTPAPDKLPANYRGVLDPLYVRTLVVDNGRSRAALVAVDVGGISTALYTKVSTRAAQELKIPAAQLLISATHTHSAPFGMDAVLEEKILQGLRDAVARLRARPDGVGHRRIAHQRQSRPHRREDEPLVGRSEHGR